MSAKASRCRVCRWDTHGATSGRSTAEKDGAPLGIARRGREGRNTPSSWGFLTYHKNNTRDPLGKTWHDGEMMRLAIAIGIAVIIAAFGALAWDFWIIHLGPQWCALVPAACLSSSSKEQTINYRQHQQDAPKYYQDAFP
jgi:hypothetical protein